MLGRQHEEAIQQFSQAVDMDKSSWKALQGLSKCLAQQGKYEEAAARLREGLDVVPPSLKWAASDLRSNLTDIILSKKDYKAAYDYAKEAYTAEPTNDSAICLYIRSLYALREFRAIGEIIQGLRQRQQSPDDKGKDNKDENWSDLDILSLRDVQDEVGRALCIIGSSTLVRPWIDACLSDPDLKVDFTVAPWLAAWLAEYMYSFYDTIDEPLQLFERIKSAKFKEDLGPELVWAYSYPSASADTYLALMYYQKAVAAHKSAQNAEEWVCKLRNLAIAEDSDGGDAPTYKMNDPALALGIYLSRYTDDGTWKHCFRNYLIQAVDMLGDEDPFNDVHAYSELCKVLLAAGDVKNASVAAAVVLTPESASSNPDKLKDLETIGFTPGYFQCDGLCTTQFHNYKKTYTELHFCRDCLDTCFCEDCFPVARRGELPYRKCSPEHQFVQLLPVPDEARDVAACFVDGKMEVRKEWLDALRREWS